MADATGRLPVPVMERLPGHEPGQIHQPVVAFLKGDRRVRASGSQAWRRCRPSGCHRSHHGRPTIPNVKYVDETIVAKQTKKAVTHAMKMKLPGIGGVQVVLTMKDLGTRDGTASSPGSRTMQPQRLWTRNMAAPAPEYNLGAWLVSETEVAYALSASPLKSDLGITKYAP